MAEIAIPRRRGCGRLETARPASEEPLPDDLELLSELGRAEANAIRHLERSNAELLAALRLGEDADFRAAVEENRAVLQRKYVRLAEISEKVGQGLVLRARACGLRLAAGSLGVAEHALRGSSPPPAAGGSGSSAWAAGHGTGGGGGAASSGAAVPAKGEGGIAPGDDAMSTLTQMQTLLRQVKRKAAELEEEVVFGSFYGLEVGPRGRRKVMELQGGAATGDLCSAPWAAGDAGDDGQLEQQLAAADVSPHGGAGGGEVPATTERLGALLRKVKRKAAELEEEVVACSFCKLSLAAQPGLGGESPERPRTRPKTAALG